LQDYLWNEDSSSALASSPRGIRVLVAAEWQVGTRQEWSGCFPGHRMHSAVGMWDVQADGA